MSGRNSESHEGGCACGAVRYRLEAQPLIVHACHCGNCQVQTGSWHAVNALIESTQVCLLQGKIESRVLPTPSGAGQTVARCGQCQVALWSNYHNFTKANGDVVRFVRVGTLDDASRLPPDVHIFADDRNTSAPDPAGAPVFARFYNPLKVWSRSSLARLTDLYLSAGMGATAPAWLMAEV